MRKNRTSSRTTTPLPGASLDGDAAAPARAKHGHGFLWVLALILLLLALVLGGTSWTILSDVGEVDTPEFAAAVASERLDLKRELRRADRNLGALQDELMEARGIASRAGAIAGTPAGAAWEAALPAGAETARLLRGREDALALALVDGAMGADESLREARLVRGTFDEIVTRMERRAEAWERVPSLRPIEGGRITSVYGVRRDPFTQRRARHHGLDLAAPHGTPVVASAKGRVTLAGWRGAYGKLVELDHGNGIRTRYGHNTRLAVRPGQMVRRGDVVAYVGSTGRASAAHVHFEVRVDGHPVDPEPYLFPDILLPASGGRSAE